MLEDLQQRRGSSHKEKARLVVTAALILSLGGFIYGSRGCSNTPTAPVLPQAGGEPDATPLPQDLDPAPFADLRAGRGDPARFDGKALDHALRGIQGGQFARAPVREFRSPAELSAADLKEWTGRLVEVRGRVRSIDKEVYASKDLPSIDQLWAFALEGEEGGRVVVVHGGLSSTLDGGRPADAYHPSAAPESLAEGDFVRVRGVVLQRRTGAVGSLSLEAPTLVLVGREYRRTDSAVPDVPGLAAIDWSSVHDRTMKETWRVDDTVHYQLLHWAGTRGHDAVMAEVRRAGAPVPWGQSEFLAFKQDLEKDIKEKHRTEDDPRTWTLAQRGRVFETSGVLADYMREDWDTVARNDYDVVTRYKYWIVSDHYANTLLLMDSAFPIETFSGMRTPRKGERPRVVATAVYVRNYSYTPRALAAKPAGQNEITVPYFQLLDMRLLPPPTATPLLENPFFWAWVSLAVFGAAFFLVMSRLEKRESAMMREKEKMVRAGARRAGSRPKPPAPPSPPKDAGPTAP